MGYWNWTAINFFPWAYWRCHVLVSVQWWWKNICVWCLWCLSKGKLLNVFYFPSDEQKNVDGIRGWIIAVMSQNEWQHNVVDKCSISSEKMLQNQIPEKQQQSRDSISGKFVSNHKTLAQWHGIYSLHCALEQFFNLICCLPFCFFMCTDRSLAPCTPGFLLGFFSGGCNQKFFGGRPL